MSEIAISIGTKVAEVAAKKGIEELIKLKKVSPLKEKIGARLAASVRLNDVPEETVNIVLEGFIKQLPIEQGKLPTMQILKAGQCDFALQILTYGTFDEIDEDELEKLASFSDEGIETLEIIPTVSSMNLFLYPLNLSNLDDILNGFHLLSKIDMEIRSKIDNFGSTKVVIILVEKQVTWRLQRAIHRLAQKIPSLEVSEFQDQYEHVGIEVVNPTDLVLKEVLEAIKGEFGGLIRKITRRV